MSFVAVDLGASGTRYTNNCGKFATIPNNVIFLEKENKVTGEKEINMDFIDMEVTSGDIMDSLEIVVEHPNDPTGFFPMHVLMGNIAERHRTTPEYPQVGVNKHAQRINYLSAVVAMALSQIQHGVTGDINLYIAVPPSQITEAKAEFGKGLTGQFTVTFPKFNGGTTVTINVVSVKCAEESTMAILSYFFGLDGKPKAESAKYLKGTVLSMDIGASTTDLAIIKNGRFLEKSGRTYPNGGNIARDYLIDAAMGKLNYPLGLEDATMAMAEGRLQFGDQYIEITELLDEAKEEVARNLVTYMDAYFQRTQIPMQAINAIVVSGGGSMKSQYIGDDNEPHITSKPLSEFITKALANKCSGVAVVNHSDNPRFANIYGLYIKAQLDAMRK